MWDILQGLTVLTLYVTVLQVPDFSSLTCSRCAPSLFETVLKNSYSQSIFKAGWLTNVSLLEDECFHNYCRNVLSFVQCFVYGILN